MMRQARLTGAFGFAVALFVGAPSALHSVNASAAGAQNVAAQLAASTVSAAAAPTPKRLVERGCTRANRKVAVSLTASTSEDGALYSMTITAVARLCTTRARTKVYDQKLVVAEQSSRVTTSVGPLAMSRTRAGAVSSAPVTFTTKTRWSHPRTVVGAVRIVVAADGRLTISLVDVHKA